MHSISIYNNNNNNNVFIQIRHPHNEKQEYIGYIKENQIENVVELKGEVQLKVAFQLIHKHYRLYN